MAQKPSGDYVKHLIYEMIKQIDDDVRWSAEPTHGGAASFSAPISIAVPESLEMHGWYSMSTGKLSFSIIYERGWRIYGLDMGSVSHKSCDGIRYDGTHKQLWTDKCEDAYAFDPKDITAEWHQPDLAWRQFCAEAHINHAGGFMLPEVQGEVLP